MVQEKKFKTNPEKYHSLLNADIICLLRVDQFPITNSICESKTDSELSFENHVEPLCQKASQKLNAL